MAEFKPALTPEEWRDGYDSEGLAVVLRNSMGTPGMRVHVTVREHPLGGALGDARDIHALAALCLHDQPFGFTREDVIRLRMFARWTEEDVAKVFRSGQAPHSDFGSESVADAQELRALADRIEALLPPDA